MSHVKSKVILKTYHFLVILPLSMFLKLLVSVVSVWPQSI